MPIVFAAPSGKTFVYLTDMPHENGQVLYSPNGKKFYQLAVYGFGGNTIEHDLSFGNLYHGINGRLHRSDRVISYEGERYVQQDVTFDPSSVVPEPVLRYVQNIYSFPDGRLLYISYGLLGRRKTEHRIYVVTEGVLTDGYDTIPRYNGWESAEYSTSDQVFFWAVPPRGGPYITLWGDISLTQQVASGYNIHETPTGQVTITRKQ
jgi:hypothetical protein